MTFDVGVGVEPGGTVSVTVGVAVAGGVDVAVDPGGTVRVGVRVRVVVAVGVIVCVGSAAARSA